MKNTFKLEVLKNWLLNKEHFALPMLLLLLFILVSMATSQLPVTLAQEDEGQAGAGVFEITVTTETLEEEHDPLEGDLFYSLAGPGGPGMEWEWCKPLQTGNRFSAVTWHGDKFVAVGDIGTVSASPISTIWSARSFHTSVVLPDGSIVLMGGSERELCPDVWRSIDQGATWTRMTAAAEWGSRDGATSVAMPDGSIVLMGGWGAWPGLHNDVWRSTDQGATWTRMTAAAEWAPREGATSVVMPDGSIVLIGGVVKGEAAPDGGYYSKVADDVWRSTDQGATWTQVTSSIGWTDRSP